MHILTDISCMPQHSNRTIKMPLLQMLRQTIFHRKDNNYLLKHGILGEKINQESLLSKISKHKSGRQLPANFTQRNQWG